MKRVCAAAVAVVLSVAPVFGQQAADGVAPEAAGVAGFAGLSGAASDAWRAKAAGVPVEASRWMVAAANPHAVQAGADVLAHGGTAADALVAVQSVLGLVEPQSSGLGGGAFLVYFDAASGEVTTLDGRETAPLAATPRLFLDEAGEPLKFFDAVVGGLSVGTPGTPGFEVSPRLAMMVAADKARLARHPQTAAYFLPKGAPVQVGDVLRNPAYAETLAVLAREGVAGGSGRRFVRLIAGIRCAGWGRPRLVLWRWGRFWGCWKVLICLQVHKIRRCGG